MSGTDFICKDCKRTFERPHVVNDYRGEFWGESCWEEMSYCPYCGSESICREWDYEDEDEEL